MKRHDKLPLKKAYYRIFTGMIVIPLVLVLVLSLVILGMQYREQAIEISEECRKGLRQNFSQMWISCPCACPN